MRHDARCTLHDARCTMHDPRCTMHDAGCRMQDAGCRMQDAGCKIQDAGCRMQDAGCTMHHARCTMHDARCTMHDVAFTLLAACSGRTRGRNLTSRLRGLVSYLDDSQCGCSSRLVPLFRRAFWRIRGGGGCIFFVSLLEGIAICFVLSLCFEQSHHGSSLHVWNYLNQDPIFDCAKW